MGLIFVLVFMGVFAVVALLMLAASSGDAQKAKQVQATLDSALATESPVLRDQIVNLRKSDQLSGIPWINQKLQKLELGPQLFSAFLVHWRFGSTLVALLVGAAFGFAPFAFVLFKRKKRFNAFQAGLPEALDLMVSALRAGHSLIAAMGLVSRECNDPVGCEFKSCFEEQNYGLELKTALDNMIARVPIQDLKIVSTAIMIQKESGGNLAEVLDKTAHVIRERFRLKRQIQVHTAQGRMTGIVLTLLPVVLAVALYFINPDMMSILWKRAIGIKLLYTAGAMIIVGGLIIRKIVNMDV